MYRLRIILFGTIGIVLGGFIGRKLYLRRRKRIEEEKLREVLERSRQVRREMARSSQSNGGSGLPDDQVCVVCVANPKEVSVLFAA